MKKTKNFFFKKKILVYGLGKSGISTYNFLKNRANLYIFDDNQKNIPKLNQKQINYREIFKTEFDIIIISPGIDIANCKLSKYLKKNYSKIYTDLDVFYEFHKNHCITITGTNGKSTTCQLMFKVLSDQNLDVKLVGNIGNPILSARNIKKKTIFVVEASSYQLDYSKIFKSKYAAILNLSPDHLERHKTLKKYIQAKFKLLKNQNKNCTAFVNKDDFLINREMKSIKLKSKVIRVVPKKQNSIFKRLDNPYFFTETNRENLSFAIEISKKFKIKKEKMIKTIKNFKGLKYRQQIIFKNKGLTIINDSKSTSFSSSLSILKSNQNIYWLLGGIHKKGDKFKLPKKYSSNIRAFIYGKRKKFFITNLKGKVRFENFSNIKNALKKVIQIIKKNKFIKQTILFSPSAASFDSFKNFEDRGNYFDNLIKKYLNGI